MPQKHCAPCHFSCLTCGGPTDGDCTACPAGTQYSKRSSNESYCLSIVRSAPSDAVRTDVNGTAAAALASGFHSAATLMRNAFDSGTAITVVLIVAVLVFVGELLRRFTTVWRSCLRCWRSDENVKSFGHAYDKVSTTDVEEDAALAAVGQA